MTTTFPDPLKRLIDRFDQQADQIRSPDYNEAQIRIEFINPMMGHLGWDIENRQGFAEQYREVVHEDSVKVAGQHKAPDYSFRIGGQRKFFLEAKKPAVNIRENTEPAYQLRRYAWSAKLACSLLTDFEELAIYDTRIRPKYLDSPATARREYIRYTDYEKRWDFIHGTFSKDAVLRGEFDRYCESKKGRGAQEFDDAFLTEIEDWREILAKNLATNNESLDQPSLNFAVQRIIDRIIFLRIAEDRGTEPVGQLQGLLSGPETYPRLCELFRRADERYNSGLFHFLKEKERDESPDTLTPNLTVTDKALKEIIKKLYYPESPYEFTMVSADILGSVYERFLGKVITLSDAHRVKIEEKPEVRKAGGVYYTPDYIVRYIVTNTVGKLLEGRTTAPTPPRLKILDPACGSGSFLIGAYQFLLDWYHQQYTAAPQPELLTQGKKPVLRPGTHGGYKLTIAERKRILLDHIHGVDLDHAAVEVTKLNLLLKCLEGETSQTLGFENRLFRERALPDLGNNIKCGNSLIGTDIIGTDAWNQMSEEERHRVNPFDYARAFPQVFKHGGFDAVIGNPPYIRIQSMSETATWIVEQLRNRFMSASQGNYDIYVVFIERSLSLLTKSGRVGLIVPSKFFINEYGRPLRAKIGKHLCQIVHFADQQIFESATTYTCLLFLNAVINESVEVVRVNKLEDWRRDNRDETGTVLNASLSGDPWNLAFGSRAVLIERIQKSGKPLDQVATRIFQGIKTGADPVFIVTQCGNGRFKSAALDREIELEPEFLKPLGKSGDFKRYAPIVSSRKVIFPYRKGKLIEWSEIEDIAPLTARYLQKCRSLLDEREHGRFSGDSWYQYSRSQALEAVSLAKILTADLNPHPNFCIDPKGEICFTGGAAGGYGLVVPTERHNEVLAILNSRLVNFYIRSTSSPFRGGWFSYEAKYLRSIPIREFNGRTIIDATVKTLLVLQQKLSTEQHPQRREQLEREIAATDRQIDQLVYELYGLTPDEIKIVEDATA